MPIHTQVGHLASESPYQTVECRSIL